MHVFLTGATGFIGARIIPELLAAGHRVTGLTRSESGARILAQAGADAHFGTLEEPETLARGAAAADAVIHAAFDHDFSRFLENCQKDHDALLAMGKALAGTNKPLIVTSGVGLGAAAPGAIAVEDVFNAQSPIPRVATETAVEKLLAQGVSAAVMRLPQVHDTRKQGLITPLIDLARTKGVSAYVDDGENAWSAAPLDDVARLYCLALDHHTTGRRYNAVAEEGVPMRAIAETIGQGLGIPVRSIPAHEASTHFGWLGLFASRSMRASSALTRERLGWTSTGPSLIDDLARMDYTV